MALSDHSDMQTWVHSANHMFTLSPDGQPPAALKLVDIDISLIQTKLCYISLSEGVFPENLKCFILFLVHK